MRTIAIAAALAALTLSGARPALADSLAEATTDWSTDIKPATDWEAVEFKDEIGQPQRLFYKTPLTGGEARLFALDPSPDVETRELSAGTAQVAVFREKRNKLSVYYLKSASASGLTPTLFLSAVVSRRDKPELSLEAQLFKYEAKLEDLGKIDWNKNPQFDKPAKTQLIDLSTEKACLWCLATGSPYKAPEGGWTKAALGKLKVIVHAPDAMHEGPFVPHTAGLAEGACVDLDGLFSKPAAALSREQQIWVGFTPAEVELQIAEVSKALSPASLYQTDAFRTAHSDLGDGKFAAAKAFVSQTRAKLLAAAKSAVDEAKKGQPEQRFTPFESRWLHCRVRHAGGDTKAKAWEKLQALAKTPEKDRAAAAKAYVAYWRSFLISDLEAYAKESTGLPELPSKPDHAALDKRIHDDTKKAAEGTPSAAAAGLAKPKVTAGKAQKIREDAGSWAEGLVR